MNAMQKVKKAEYLRRLLKKSGMNYKEVASRVDRSYTYIVGYFNGTMLASEIISIDIERVLMEPVTTKAKAFADTLYTVLVNRGVIIDDKDAFKQSILTAYLNNDM